MSKPHTITKFKEMPREVVYEQGKDLTSTLYNIVVDMREEADQGMVNDWSISPKQLKACNVKVHGTGDKPRVELRVSEFHGGYLGRNANSCELAARCEETVKLLKKFEKDLKKEFKKRTGKTLSLSKADIIPDYHMVAANGLWRFVATKVSEVRVKLDGQSWERDD